MTYHVLPIGVTILVIYLFSLYLSASGFTARQSHRRFWNWLLLVALLTAGLIGLFLALKITYRWEVKFAESLMHWHVEAGIAMAFSAFIHLSWHLGYYFKRRRAGDNGLIMNEPRQAAMISPSGLKPLLILTGFVSSSSQFILLREAAILGGGTEATTGLFLWIWLIIAAGGAVTGNRSAITSPGKMIWTLLAGTALAPLCFLLMNTIVLSPGQTPSFFQTMVIVAVTVAPVTFIAALIFVRMSVIRHQTGLSGPGNSFGIETAGSVAAGIITAMTVTLRIPNYQLYMLILLAGSVYAAWFLGYPMRVRIASLALLVPLGLLLFFIKPDRVFRGMLLRGVAIEKSIDTPFGNITTGLYGDDLTVYYDHRPLYYSSDIVSAEENIHYGLLQRESYDRVLLISGGLRRHLPELLKYNIRELTYLEMDPGLIAIEGARDTLCGSMAVKVVRDDPVSFLRGDDGTWDAVIQLIPPPSTLSVSRFYTAGYFRIVKEQLSPGGLFVCTPMPWFNYSPESYRKGFSPVWNALTGVFSHVTLIPGSLLYAVASGEPVTPSVARLASERDIETSYVNSDYLIDSEIKTRGEQILSHVDRDAAMNTALRPVTSLFANVLSLERMGMKGGLIVMLVILIIVPFAFLPRGGPVMFASSAGLAGFGMIMIFILQMAAGNIYILSSVILTLLMAGLAAGASLGDRLGLRSLRICVLLFAAILTVSGLLAPSLVVASPVTVMIYIFTMLPAAGLITGAVYRILTAGRDGRGSVKEHDSGRGSVKEYDADRGSVNEHDAGRGTGKVYAADLAGSALGYLTAATILVPLAGAANACFILGLLILISGTVASVAIKQ